VAFLTEAGSALSVLFTEAESGILIVSIQSVEGGAMKKSYSLVLRGFLVLVAGLLCAPGCTTKAAKKALNKPYEEEAFSGFAKDVGKDSERHTDKAEPIADDMEPEKAVDLLIDHLQRPEPNYYIPAESQLRYWATKQGVAEIIVRKARMLLKHPRIETRAPALRLVCTYGGKDSIGDLIETLADPDYGMRRESFETLRVRAGMDLGYQPGAGDVARAQSIQRWREWWQDNSRTIASTQVAAPKYEQPAPPTVIRPDGKGKEGPVEFPVPPPPQEK
jgi:hypothetical protein